MLGSVPAPAGLQPVKLGFFVSCSVDDCYGLWAVGLFDGYVAVALAKELPVCILWADVLCDVCFNRIARLLATCDPYLLFANLK